MDDNWNMSPEERRFRTRLWRSSAGFCLASALFFLLRAQYMNMLVCLGTVVLVSLPFLMGRLLGFGLRRSFFVFCLLYALGPMLGKAFRLYYLTTWWDKLLHTCGGVTFGVFGVYIALRLNSQTPLTPVLRAVFGLCFSIAVSAVWEFFEYGVDFFFAADMQQDTVVNAIHSHYLSTAPGVLRSIPVIREVSLDGAPLDIGGYLDIGLIDTMHDMLVEALGALAFFLWYLADKDRHPLIFLPEKPDG